MSRLSGVRGKHTWTTGNITNGSESTTTTTVPGVKYTDKVFATLAEDQQSLVLSGHVSAPNTLEFDLINNTGGPIDLGTVTVYYKVAPWESL